MSVADILPSIENARAKLVTHTNQLAALDAQLTQFQTSYNAAIVEMDALRAGLSKLDGRFEEYTDKTSSHLRDLIHAMTEQMLDTYVRSDEFKQKLEEALDDRTPQEDVDGAQGALPASFSGRAAQS
ncbi:hypothetical protein CYMTET_54333 [Cymbomonas tetramitiformis]|uniref:Uncharacterized protein n=1 Tax=Cymbomonas tetramitiformis TaxID=36881 RepID=A0AAE0BGA0_9CHLO|nr:hypothetical protein CYMTET_54333 [Cymbomonas tetramitiformis]